MRAADFGSAGPGPGDEMRWYRDDTDASRTDRELVEQARGGDDLAFAALWSRHRAAALAAARTFTDLEAEDLVSDAYAAILAAFRRGKGPEGEAFRPYLCTVVRNLARRRGAARRELNVEELPELAEDDLVLEEQLDSLEQRLVRTAFASLPARWREALWYSEVEGLSPAEFASRLGLGANAAAALAYRAREGLRRAWLQAHIADAERAGECGWVLTRIGEHSRDALGRRAGSRVDAHLAQCGSCRDIALEVGRANRQLASILVPALLGGGIATWWLAAPAAPASAAVAVGGGLGAVGSVTAGIAAVGLLGGLVLGPAVVPAPAAGTPGVHASSAASTAPPPVAPTAPAGLGGFGVALPESGVLPGALQEVAPSLASVTDRVLAPITATASGLVSTATGGIVAAEVRSDLSGAVPSISIDGGLAAVAHATLRIGAQDPLDLDLDLAH